MSLVEIFAKSARLPAMDVELAQRTYRTMREFAGDERPRERLIEHGPSVLGEAELVAVILGSGSAGENVLDLARRVVESAGGLAGLLRADVASLMATKGLGPAKATQLAAAIELGRRVQGLDPESRPRLMSADAVYYLMRGRLAGKTKETLFVLSLDTKGRLLSTSVAAEGTLAEVHWRAADVFRDPVISQATSIVLVHNHPSGDPAPSPQDVSSTRKLRKVAEELDIELRDHVIIGQNRFSSLGAMGLLGGGS